MSVFFPTGLIKKISDWVDRTHTPFVKSNNLEKVINVASLAPDNTFLTDTLVMDTDMIQLFVVDKTGAGSEIEVTIRHMGGDSDNASIKTPITRSSWFNTPPYKLITGRFKIGIKNIGTGTGSVTVYVRPFLSNSWVIKSGSGVTVASEGISSLYDSQQTNEHPFDAWSSFILQVTPSVREEFVVRLEYISNGVTSKDAYLVSPYIADYAHIKFKVWGDDLKVRVENTSEAPIDFDYNLIGIKND